MSTLYPYSGIGGPPSVSQSELSRHAAERYAQLSAVREAARSAPRPEPQPGRRVVRPA